MDLGHVVLALGWLVTGALWYWRSRPVPIVLPEPISPLLVKKALLLNAEGRLDSVRTLTGAPPDAITCAAGSYQRVDATGDHWVYRWR
jgi:hypothetical protein